MVTFLNNSDEEPYIELRKRYYEAFQLNENLIDVILIASYSEQSNEVDSRAVNLKIIDNNEFIFFSNYDSPKAIQFQSHDQISVTIIWSSTNTQIRLMARIKKTSKKFNKSYFQNRQEDKNALAIASYQSKKIESYDLLKDKYNKVLRSSDLKSCPDYWGGYSFKPYYFEFWEGHDSRINKRLVFKKDGDNWNHFIIQP